MTMMTVSAQAIPQRHPQVLPANGSDFRIPWLFILRQCWFLIFLSSLGTLSYLLISHFIFQAAEVEGPSMSPTLSDTGHYWVNRFCYVIGQPRQEDIVEVKDPSDNGLDVKRVIATPGQSVLFKDGSVYIDGKLLSEPYLMPQTQTFANSRSGNALICLGKNQFFVMGDNRGNSDDSRIFGAVPRQNILGRIIE
jgi:signal peptidase I